MTDININDIIIDNNDDTLSIISEVEIELESIIDDDINYMYNSRWTKYIDLFREKYSDPIIIDIEELIKNPIIEVSIQDSIEN